MTSRLGFFLSLLVLLTVNLFAQGRGGRSSGSTGTTRRTTPSLPTNPQRTLFLTGHVVVDDGTPVTDPVAIQTNCRGQLRTRGYSDAKGYFSIELGGTSQTAEMASSDASESLQTPLRGSTRFATNEWQGCQLQGNLAGFTSQLLELETKVQDMGPNDVGKIVLHRMEQVGGFTISATSAAAPSKAKKDYEKGVEQFKKGKLDDAEKKLAEATTVYPNYAVAWVELGRVQVQKHNNSEAKTSFQHATSADAKLITPYEELARMALNEKDWPQLDSVTDKLLELNPVSFPEYWYYNAAANYYLQRSHDCEESARRGLRVDSQHRIPKLELLLAAVLSDRHSYQEAAQHMRNFANLLPPGAESDDAQKKVHELEQLSAKAEVAQ